MTCPEVGNNRPKGLLIPHMVGVFREPHPKVVRSLPEGPAAHQVVGGVMAYQADDG